MSSASPAAPGACPAPQPRPARWVAPAAALLAVGSALAGCSSGSSTSTAGSSTTSGPSSASTSSPAAASGSSTAGASGSSTSGTGTTTSAPPPAPSVSAAEATRIATSLLSAAAQAETDNGAAAARARGQAFTASALQASVADAKLAAVAPQLSLGRPAITAERPGVLAISRGGYPRVIVAQAEPKGSLYPVLYLLSSTAPSRPHRIAASALMLPATAVHGFAPLSIGSPLLSSAAGQTKAAGLSTPVGTLASTYAKSLSYPVAKVSNPPFGGGDRFAAQLRQNAALEASQVKGQAVFTQRHSVVPASVYAVGQADGGVLVFATLQRRDDFAVQKTQQLRPSRGLLAFEPKLKTVRSHATLTTLEFLVFQVPARSTGGRATLLAASEHLVGATGR